MKKIGLYALTLLLFVFPASNAHMASKTEDASIMIDGKNHDFSPSPVIREGHMMVPMRSFFEELGANVKWHNDKNIALAYHDGIDVENSLLNSEEKENIDTPARVIDGDLFVPLRLAGETLGYSVGWDEEKFSVIMSKSSSNGAGYLAVDRTKAEEEKEDNPSEGTGSFIWPVNGGQITSPYGMRNGRFHAGTDIGARTGTEIFAADNGVVVFEGWDGAYGRSIVVNHGKYYTRYAHNSANLVGNGDTVSQGQIIAKIGATGRASGPHLHFEIRTGGIYGSTINPIKYVSR